MQVELRLCVPDGHEQTGRWPTTLQRPPSMGQTEESPAWQGFLQAPSMQACVRPHSVSRSQGLTRFRVAEAESPVSCALVVARSSRSSRFGLSIVEGYRFAVSATCHVAMVALAV